MSIPRLAILLLLFLLPPDAIGQVVVPGAGPICPACVGGKRPGVVAGVRCPPCPGTVVTPPPAGPLVVAVVTGQNMAPVYRINANGSRGDVVIGFVPVGTPCSGPVVYTYRSRGFRRIAPTAVRWWNTASTTSAAAPCG